MDDMLKYLNNHKMDDTYSRIIIYIISNKDKISNLSITELAENCFVSISTISRFSRFFSYATFQSMKADLQKEPSLGFTLRLNKNSFYRLNDTPDHFFADLGNQIIESIQDTINTVDVDVVDDLIQDIMSYEKVYLFGYDSTLDLLKRVQSTFLNNKLLFMAYPDDLQLKLTENLNENCLCLIVSSYGTLFSKFPDLIWNITNSNARTIFLTQGTTNVFTSAFDKVISISSKPNPITGNISMEFFLEYLGKRSLKLLSQI